MNTFADFMGRVLMGNFIRAALHHVRIDPYTCERTRYGT